MLPLRNLKRFFQKALKQPVYAIRVGTRRLGAYLAYLTAGGRAGAPEAITFFLTHSCNLRCRMCGQWGDHGITKKERADESGDWLPLDEIKSVIDSVKPFGPSVTLFGGEPFLHPQIIAIIDIVKKAGLHGLVITNGALLERFGREAVLTGIDELNISIDGGQARHDGIRGLPGVFETIMRGIARVNAAKKESKRHKPLINIQCTVSKFNYEHLEELLEVARQAKADSLTFHHLIFVKPESVAGQKSFDEMLGCSSKDWEGFAFEPGIDPAALYAKFEEIKLMAKRESFSVDIFPNFSKKGIEVYYKDADYLPSEYAPRCLSPWVCGYVFPNGDVRPCLNCSYSLGNIKQADFLKVWNSPSAIRYRETLKKEGIFPVCRRCTELYRY